MSNHDLEFKDENEIQRFADIFKALSNPNRLKIFLELLPHLQSGGVCTSDTEQVDACQQEMAARMNIAPSTVSHHIKELKHAGLVNIIRCGRNVDIQINPETLHLLKTFLK
jgi:ArsR family transcriptional regulator